MIVKSKIDIEDIDKIKKIRWFLQKGREYVVGKIKGNKAVRLHRFIMTYNKNNNSEIDHINRDKLDNRKENLRFVTRRQNMLNTGIPINNTSGTKGIYLDKRTNKWDARITIHKKPLFLGSFKDKENAIKTRQNAEIIFGGIK